MLALKALRTVLGRLETSLAAISNGLVISDENGLIIWSNLGFQQLVKKSSLELLGKPLHQSLTLTLTHEQSEQLELNTWDKNCKERFIIKHEPLFALEFERHSIMDQGGKASIMQISDVSAEASINQSDEIIRYLTEEAKETLPAHIIEQIDRYNKNKKVRRWNTECKPSKNLASNRSQLLKALTEQSKLAREAHRQIYIMHCKLNNLLDIQYLHSMQAVHVLLQAMCEKANLLLGAEDHLVQISADSLAITLATIASLPEAIQLGEQMHNLFTQPLSWEGHTIVASISIGVTRTGKLEEDVAALLMQAQQAAEAMKQRSGLGLFQPNL